jgi:hypothetical protein
MLRIRNNSITRGVGVLRLRPCFPMVNKPTSRFLQRALKRRRRVLYSRGVAAEDADP